MEAENADKSVVELLDQLNNYKTDYTDKSINFGFKVYDKCLKENYDIGKAVSLLHIGRIYFRMSKNDKAMSFLLEAIDLAQNIGICDLQLIAQLNIGNIYFDIGEYEKSLDFFDSAEKLAGILEHSQNYYSDCYEYYASKIWNNVGEVYRILQCYDDAIHYYKLSEKYDKVLDFKACFGVELSNIGIVEYFLGNYDEALKYLNEGLMYLEKNNYISGIIEAYGIIALIFEIKNETDKANEYFEKAIKISSKIDYEYDKIDVLLNYGKFLYKTGKEKLAINKFNEAYNISCSNNLYGKSMELCKKTIDFFTSVGNTECANKFYKVFFDNDKKLEHVMLESRQRAVKERALLNSLKNENHNILEKSEKFRKKVEDLVQINSNISIISELGEKMTTTSDLREIYIMLHDTIRTFMKADTFGVGIYYENENKIVFNWLIEDNTSVDGYEVKLNSSSLSVKCLKEKRIIAINDMKNEYMNYLDDKNYFSDNIIYGERNSAIYCPLIINDAKIGVITVQTIQKNVFTNILVKMIKVLSSYAAIAINNAIKSMDLLIEIEQRKKIQLELESMNNKLIYLSENDGLTNIPNRRKLDAVINELWNEAKNNKSKFSLIIFDVDCFKQYNDNYGHTQGDKCLISVSIILNESLKDEYFAARYGGDEFVILLPRTELDEAMTFGDNIRKKIENNAIPHMYSKVKKVVTITMGIATVIPCDNITINEFFRQADNSLYEAKHKGRNRVVGKMLLV